jgi:hypothetical protein
MGGVIGTRNMAARFCLRAGMLCGRGELTQIIPKQLVEGGVVQSGGISKGGLHFAGSRVYRPYWVGRITRNGVRLLLDICSKEQIRDPGAGGGTDAPGPCRLHFYDAHLGLAAWGPGVFRHWG